MKLTHEVTETFVWPMESFFLDSKRVYHRGQEIKKGTKLMLTPTNEALLRKFVRRLSPKPAPKAVKGGEK